jgi:hypothetical protein
MGQFIHHAGQSYIVVRVRLIQQAVAVHIHRDEVVPLAPPVLASTNGPCVRVSHA